MSVESLTTKDVFLFIIASHCDCTHIQVRDPISGQCRAFTFNVVFEPEATQEEVFEHSGVKRLIDMSLDG